jgi:hypothetical protein
MSGDGVKRMERGGVEERGSIVFRYKLVVSIVNDLVCSFAAPFFELWHKAMIRAVTTSRPSP